jgi:hypothetical protein
VVDVVDPDAGESAALGLAPLLALEALPVDPEALPPPMFCDRGEALLLPSDPEDLLLEAVCNNPDAAVLR